MTQFIWVDSKCYHKRPYESESAEGTLPQRRGGGLQWHSHRQKTATAEAGRGKEWILSYGLQGEPYHTLTLAKRKRWWP